MTTGYLDDIKAQIDRETDIDNLRRAAIGWAGDCARHLQNEEYYRGLLDACAPHLGIDAYTQDDGGLMDEPLRAKVPELVKRLAVRERDALVAADTIANILNARRQAAIDVLTEREKQRVKWGDMHDDEHDDGVLGDAAATLAAQADSVGTYIEENGEGHLWPGNLRHRHRGDRRKQIVIAAALLLAEIERIDRADGVTP